MSINVTISVSAEVISDTLCTAIEGNLAQWITQVDWGHIGEISSNRDERYQYLENAINDETEWEIRFKDIEGYWHTMNHENVALGLQKMANSYSNHFEDMINQNGDAITADVFLQSVLLGYVMRD